MQVTKTVRLAAGAGSVEEAITTALARAAETTSGITSFKVVEVAGRVDASGVPAEYQVTIDVSFVVKDIAEAHGQ